MKRIRIAALALVLLTPPFASSSHFEFCDMEATIQSVTLGPDATYELVVDVITASTSEEQVIDSHVDCSAHAGKPMQVTFDASELPSLPARGDRLWFSRSVVDGFGIDGAYAGTSTRTHLREMRKAIPASSER